MVKNMQYLIKNINLYKINNLNNFFTNINDYKKNRINKILNIKKRKQSIIGELLLKKLIEENYNINYNILEFKTNKNGKQFITNFNIHHNISHSNDYVITAISENKIGVDIEKIRKTNIRTIYQFATLNERNYILSNNENIEKRLFEIYTLKEAYFKMKGTNLNSIKNIEFTIDKSNILCSDNKIQAKLIDILPNYIIAICEEKNED